MEKGYKLLIIISPYPKLTLMSNPPYYSEDLAATKPQRSLARQGKNLDTSALVSQIDRLISDTGTCALVLPYSSLESIKEILVPYNLYLQKICQVCATPHKEPSRVLILLGREIKPLKEERLVIQTGGANEYSHTYLDLTQDFYLNLS